MELKMERSGARPHPLTDLALFNNQIHALTLIQRYCYRPLPFLEHSHVRNNLKLLDSLALLLDQNQEGAVATSMQLTRSSFKLYWARNDNVQSDLEKGYMHKILKHAQDRTDFYQILIECVGHTKERIVSKCQELAKMHCLSPENQRLMSEDFLCIDKDRNEYRQLERELKAHGVIDKDGSFVQYMDKVLRCIARATNASSTVEIKAIVNGAYGLCSRRHKLSIWTVDKAYHSSVEQLEGLAAYMVAVRDLMREVRNLWNRGYRTFEFEQVFSTRQPYESLPNGPVLDALNTWADHYSRSERIESFKKVDKYFADTECGPEGMIAIQHSQHAELTLAQHFIEERLSAGPYGIFAIGVSRGTCYWCNMWLDIANDQLRSSDKKVAVRTMTGQRIDGWIQTAVHMVVCHGHHGPRN